ncbi:Hypothetical predicted protein [Pelobates cultripes]|uniref:Uncharacterized protein n=1 Tax=Pelobates cultripes TaxID=61616 RepID=A0AAD1R0Z1_PELCU|nr:Hypothetical predicted protein [Pelobates cultripes]
MGNFQPHGGHCSPQAIPTANRNQTAAFRRRFMALHSGREFQRETKLNTPTHTIRQITHYRIFTNYMTTRLPE